VLAILGVGFGDQFDRLIIHWIRADLVLCSCRTRHDLSSRIRTSEQCCWHNPRVVREVKALQHRLTSTNAEPLAKFLRRFGPGAGGFACGSRRPTSFAFGIGGSFNSKSCPIFGLRMVLIRLARRVGGHSDGAHLVSKKS